MSTMGAAEWDLTVPAEDAELVAEFRRHGVLPGQKVHVSVVSNSAERDTTNALPSFFNSIDGPVDLAERSSEILREEFPSGR